MKQPIKEGDNAQEQWYKDAREQTLETLPEFLRHLTEDYEHDYGTICHALAAGAVATTWALNASKQGGITGFQAGAIMWEYMKHWNNVNPPARLVQYENMLYPQYRGKFEKIISKDTWDWLQEKAASELQKDAKYHPEVRAHLESIVRGTIPFGYAIEED